MEFEPELSKKNYEMFSGEELIIADKIQRLRLRLLVHSCIYYELNKNIISDKDWDDMAKELTILQTQHQVIAKKVMWYDAFKDWDGSTGMDLPLKNTWVLYKAKQLLGYKRKSTVNDVCRPSQRVAVTSGTKKKSVKRGRLF